MIYYLQVLGMSTRKGTAVFLADIIKEATAVMHACMQKDVNRYARIEDPIATSREIGLSAIKIQDMQAKRQVDHSIQTVVTEWLAERTTIDLAGIA
jgi:arginyl-tRNA synthetase